MLVYILTITLIVLQIIAGKLVFDRVSLPRWVTWLIVLLAYTTVHFASFSETGFIRMVLLCSYLIAGMKWVVYSEWRRAGGVVLNWGRWSGFGFLWFGMDPAAWIKKKKNVSWKRDSLWGLGCLVFGLLTVAMLAHYQVQQLVLLFVAMSVGFHYGALRLLTAFWRFCGIPVRVLFRNPLITCGFADFWGKRWNLAYSQMMVRVVQRPLSTLLGAKNSQFSVFAISGLLHELAITVPVQAGYGLPTIFFLVQGLFTRLERRRSRWMGYLCIISLLIGMPLLFPSAFVEAVILPARDVFNLF